MSVESLSVKCLIKGGLTAYPVPIKDESELIRADLHIWLTSRPGPAHSHVSSSHGLKFKVPLPGPHCVRPLHSEEAHLVDTQPLNHLSYGWRKKEPRCLDLDCCFKTSRSRILMESLLQESSISQNKRNWVAHLSGLEDHTNVRTYFVTRHSIINCII